MPYRGNISLSTDITARLVVLVSISAHSTHLLVLSTIIKHQRSKEIYMNAWPNLIWPFTRNKFRFGDFGRDTSTSHTFYDIFLVLTLNWPLVAFSTNGFHFNYIYIYIYKFSNLIMLGNKSVPSHVFAQPSTISFFWVFAIKHIFLSLL